MEKYFNQKNNHEDKLQSFETFRGFAALMVAAIHFNVNSPLVTHPLASGTFVHFFLP